MKIISVLSILCLFTSVVYAQKTEKLLEGQTSPAASIEDVSWIAGHWVGEAWGGKAEEIWSEPLGGAMMGSFRHVVEGKVSLYEFMNIVEAGNSLMLKIKHFNGDLSGWEEKGESVDFELVKLGKNMAYFNEFTFELKDEDHLSLYVLIEGKEETFNYQRLK